MAADASTPLDLRGTFTGCAVGVVLSVSFPDSAGIWPLRLAADWPGELGRAMGNLLTSGKLEPLALGHATDLTLLSGTQSGRAVAALIGLAVALAAAVGFVWLASRPVWTRRFFVALALAFGIAALWPPTIVPLSAVELSTALGAGAVAILGNQAQATGLQLLAGLAATSPLADLRPMLLGIGRAQGITAVLETATGVAAPALALFCFGLFAAAVVVLARRTARPPSIPATATEVSR